MNYDLLFSTKGEKKLEVAVIGVRGFNHSLLFTAHGTMQYRSVFFAGELHRSVLMRICR